MTGMVAVESLLASYRRQAEDARWRDLTSRALGTRGFGRLPAPWLRQLARYLISRSVGQLQPGATKLVTIVSHELAAAGAPKVLLEVVRACVTQNWATIVIAPADGPYADLMVEAGAVVVVSPEALTRLSPAIDLAMYSDVVICNTIVCIELVLHLPPQKTVWYLHETGAIDTQRSWHAELPDALRQVADVWAASPLVASHVQVERPDAIVIVASSDPAQGAPHSTREPVQAVVLGGLEERKGQDLLLEAYRMLPDDLRAKLVVSFYGRRLRPEYARLIIEQIALTPGLNYGGSISPSAATSIIAQSDMLIVCSRDEPLSLVAIEALSAGKVVVCSRDVGISHYLSDGIDAYVAPSSSATDLRDALDLALRTRSTWTDVGEAGRRVWEERFSPSVFQKAVVAQLQIIISGKQGSVTKTPEW